MVIDEAGDFARRGQPQPVAMRGDMGECRAELSATEGLAADKAVQDDAHHHRLM